MRWFICGDTFIKANPVQDNLIKKIKCASTFLLLEIHHIRVFTYLHLLQKHRQKKKRNQFYIWMWPNSHRCYLSTSKQFTCQPKCKHVNWKRCDLKHLEGYLTANCFPIERVIHCRLMVVSCKVGPGRHIQKYIPVYLIHFSRKQCSIFQFWATLLIVQLFNTSFFSTFCSFLLYGSCFAIKACNDWFLKTGIFICSFQLSLWIFIIISDKSAECNHDLCMW